MDELEIELVPFIDKETGGVTVIAAIKNTSEETKTIVESTSQLFKWEITDENGHRYMEPRGALLAPHRVKIEPEKVFITATRKLPPDELEKEWRQTPSVDEDTRIFTDPVEAANYSTGPDIIRAPTPSPDSNRKLHVNLKFETSSGGTYSISKKFIPAKLSMEVIEDIKNDYDVDEEADLSLTGKKGKNF